MSGEVGGADRCVARGVTQIGHRGQVVALGGSGALVPDTEEADRELGVGVRGGRQDVVAGDGGAGRDVPGRLAVGLDEVRIAAGQPLQLLERVVGEVDTLAVDRLAPPTAAGR